MKVSSGDIAAAAYMLVLLVLGAFMIGYLVASQHGQQSQKTSAGYCEAKLRDVGYEKPANKQPEPNSDDYKRSFDVCLQIRAAEAAEDSAAYAIWGVALAGMAAFAAAAAAGFTWRQANHAAEQVAIMRGQQRPWLCVRPKTATPIAIPALPEGHPQHIRFAQLLMIENFGKSPSTDAMLAAGLRETATFDNEGFLAGKMDNEFGWSPLSLVTPGGVSHDTRHIHTSVVPTKFDDGRQGVSLILVTMLKYTVEGTTRHTRQAFFMSRINNLGLVQPLFIGAMDPKDIMFISDSSFAD